MADTYPDYATLARHEISGLDFGIAVRQSRDAFVVVAPHGGGIEPGTSELADAVADIERSFYAFEGLKPTNNAVLHITSTRFDEPLCLQLLSRAQVVVTLHGEHGDDIGGAAVFLGGRDDRLAARLRASFIVSGFDVRCHTDPDLQGRDPRNLCNRGRSGAGVQLELSRALRRSLFESLSREGRRHPLPRFHDFVTALRRVLTAGAP